LGKAIVRPADEEFRSRARVCVKLIQFVGITLTSSGRKPVSGARNSSKRVHLSDTQSCLSAFSLMRWSSINLNHVTPGGALLRTRCRPQIGETITIEHSKDRVRRDVAAAALEHAEFS
jgi:hypothetical protein